ncbi:hypothetical protein [uncultured Tessaracoccus sp.]|uniref:hypothetical protein n=1 Tax=uncultured Tessaracoccus sp. TaxID=905023 RepID=UPI0025CBA9A2|nr:hypothetical protein [uncultured Tessaracoccus sp.]
MGITSAAIHLLTGVGESTVDAGALSTLADHFGTVASTANSVFTGTSGVVDDVSQANAGAALSAYQGSMKGTLDHLTYLEERATATQTAHSTASDTVASAQLSDQTVCVRAAQILMRVNALPLSTQTVQIWKDTIEATRKSLLAIMETATSTIENAYSGILPLKELPGLSEGERRGTVPPSVADDYAALDPQQRMEFLRNLADKQMEGWPDADRQAIVFYSNQEPQPPGTVPPPSKNDDWSEYNGVHSGDTVYLNYDIGVGDDPSTGQAPKPTLMSTTVHELQHSQQDRLQKQYDALSDSDIEAIRNGTKDDPFVAEGSTLDEVERLQTPYRDADDPGYEHQPAEIDARRGGTEVLDDMTEEDFKDLMP